MNAHELVADLYEEKEKVSSTLYAMTLPDGVIHDYWKVEGDTIQIFDSRGSLLQVCTLHVDAEMVWRKRHTRVIEEYIVAPEYA